MTRRANPTAQYEEFELMNTYVKAPILHRIPKTEMTLAKLSIHDSCHIFFGCWCNPTLSEENGIKVVTHRIKGGA